MTPKATVAMPPKSSQSPPNRADAPGLLAEQEQPEPQHDIDADLGQDGEDRSDRRAAAA